MKIVDLKGNCTTGRGCVCGKGFTGAQCEIPTTSATSMLASTTRPGGLMTKKLLSSKRPSKSNVTKAHRQRVKTTKPPEIPLKYLSTLEMKTDEYISLITSCENGGLFVDNSCLCLNQYTGQRCEIAPEQSMLNLNESANSSLPVKPEAKTKILPNSKLTSKGQVTKASNTEEKLALLSLKRLNDKIEENTNVIISNATINKRTNWPWLGN